MKHRHFGRLAMLAASLVIASSANAATYSFDFLATDSSYQVSGFLNVDSVLNTLGAYNILGISGTVTGNGGGSISGLVDNPNKPNITTTGPIMYDNNLIPSTPQLNYNGILFTTDSGSHTWNIYSSSPTTYSLWDAAAVNKTGTFVAAAVPEPETFAMLLSGLGLIGFIGRRRSIGAANA